MKKIYLLFTLLFFVFFANAQYDTRLAMDLVNKHSAEIGLSADQLKNLEVSSTYYNEPSGTQLVYLVQTYKGLPVYTQMLVLAFKADKVVSNAGSFIPEMEKASNHQPATPSITPGDAVRIAFTETHLSVPSNLPLINSSKSGSVLDFGKPANVTENVIAELMWVPIESGNQKTVKLAWQVQVAPVGKADWWNIQIDAVTGVIIKKYNQTIYERKFQTSDDNISSLLRPKEDKSVKKVDVKKLNLFTPPPPTVTSADYRVLPFPIESPNYGAFSTVNNPWNLSGAGNNATTHGWHFDGTTNYNFTRGNNTFAYLDVQNTNAPNATNNWPDTSTTAIPGLTFTQVFDPAQQPAVNLNKKAVLNNLFYWNNLMHDVYYQYGFNEVSGNYQTDNLGRGGNGNDYVQAEAQDASGTNNANFNAGGPDGGRPRMQMYLWSPAASSTTLHVNAPVPIIGNYGAVESNFSPNNLLANVGPKTGDVIYFNDAAGTHEACAGAPTNVLTGKIALINRGNCNFTVKVLAAQAAGAIAVIMVNNVAGAPIIMGGGPDPTITIPAVMVSDADGALFAAQIANGLNVTLSGTPASTINLDGDVDNGIVCHEFGHGISNRLTGGPATTACLGNAEEGGEGWSDFQGLMMTTNWATAQITDGANAHPMGTYAFGQQATGPGIRNYPYSTNIAINPLTYANLGVAPIGTEVHNIGEVWCMALWEMTWGLIQQNGISPNLFDATGTGGNIIAMKLEIEGMKLQPCSPGFVDARNAILTADQNLYGGAHLCTLWAAFAKRGLGYSALQGSSGSASDQTAAFNLPPAAAFTAQPADVSACAGTNAVFTVAASGYNLTYNWQVSINGGLNWNNVVPPNTTNTLTLTGVTAGMNGYQYRCVISGGCPNTAVNSNAATLSVNTSSPTITSQPVNTSTCVGTDATFTIAVSGTNTYNWQFSTDGGVTWNNVSPVNTTTSLTLTAVTLAMNGYQYRCQVTGGCPPNTINSTAATLTVTTGGLSITAQPANTSACVGANASFSVTATGATSYNWQFSTDGGVTWNNVVPAATTATLNLTGVTAAMNGYQYRCVVNGPGACTAAGLNSSPATLTVNNPIAITSQPANVSVCAGGNATFSVTATGTNPTYNWQVSTDGGATWNNVSPVNTTTSLTLTAVTAGMNGYQYRCQVAGTCTAVAINSNAATLTINTSASITSQPSNASVCVGTNATFSVTATGTGVTYNWQVSTDGGITWNNVSPVVTTATLTLTAVTTGMNNYQYRCVVSVSCNPVGINSNAATLTVNSVSITTQPANAGVCAGVDATFTVVASGAGLAYNWQVSTDGGTTWNNVSPANNTTTLTVTAPTLAMSGYKYRCVVTGTCSPGGVNSNAATLTVNTSVTLTSQPTDIIGCTGSAAVFTVTATGSSITYQWQVSVNGGPFVNLTNTPPYSGVTTNTLTINPATGLNGNRYRLNASGAPCGGIVTSSSALLDVKPLPVVVLTAASYSNITPYIRTTLYTTVSPPGNYSYQWFRDGVLVPSITADRFAVTVDDFGVYEVIVTDLNSGCSSKKSNTQKVDFAASDLMFIFPNPSSGHFEVRYLSYTNTVPRTLNIYDSKGARVYQKVYTTNAPYTKMDVNMDNAASDVYLVELMDANGKRLATGKVVIR